MKIDANRATVISQRVEQVWPPPIPFKRNTQVYSSKSTKDNGDEYEELDKDRYRTYTLKVNPASEDSDSYTRKVRIFEDGTPEDWIRHQMEIGDLFKAYAYTAVDVVPKDNVYQSLYYRKAKEWYMYIKSCLKESMPYSDLSQLVIAVLILAQQ